MEPNGLNTLTSLDVIFHQLEADAKEEERIMMLRLNAAVNIQRLNGTGRGNKEKYYYQHTRFTHRSLLNDFLPLALLCHRRHKNHHHTHQDCERSQVDARWFHWFVVQHLASPFLCVTLFSSPPFPSVCPSVFPTTPKCSRRSQTEVRRAVMVQGWGRHYGAYAEDEL